MAKIVSQTLGPFQLFRADYLTAYDANATSEQARTPPARLLLGRLPQERPAGEVGWHCQGSGQESCHRARDQEISASNK